MSNEELKTAVDEPLDSFIEVDHELLWRDVSERAISHKFAEHIQRRFPDWQVDCEYNRFEFEKKVTHISKRIWSQLVKEGQAQETIRYEDLLVDDAPPTVFPDIIVHHRGVQENLLVIEIKKAKSPDIGWDERKLDAYIRELGYRIGLLLVFVTGKNSMKRKDLVQQVTWLL